MNSHDISNPSNSDLTIHNSHDENSTENQEKSLHDPLNSRKKSIKVVPKSSKSKVTKKKPQKK